MKRSIATYLAAPLLGAAALAQGDGLPRAPASPELSADAPELQDPADRIVEPAAIDAMIAMGESLRALDQFEITAQTATESFLENGLKVTLRGEVVAKARRPNHFAMEVRTDHGRRRYVYDGSTLTIHTPGTDGVLQVSAAGTIEEVLDLAYEKYGLELPLKELFLWSEVGRNTDEFETAVRVGSSTIAGETCDHFVYRGPRRDWQIWMTRGDRRLPCKVNVTRRFQSGMPEFVADLAWRTDVTFPPETFVFSPPAGAESIALADLTE